MPQPQQSYYSRALVRLFLRFDEFGATNMLAPAPTVTTKNIVGTGTPRSNLTAQLDPSAPPGVTRYVLAPPGGAVITSPLVAPTSSSDGLTFDVTFIPKHLTWSLNGIKTANTASIVGKFVDCPIDPRVVRACMVHCYHGCIAEDDAVAAIEHSGATGAPVLPPDFVGPHGETRTNLRFQGWATKWSNKFSDGEPTLNIEAQDHSMLLHNQEVPPRAGIALDQPLDLAIAQYLASNFVQFAGITVQYLPVTDGPPRLQDILSEHVAIPGVGLTPSGCAAGSQKMTVMDFLVDVGGMTAHTIRMDGTTLLIQRARSLLANTVVPRSDDPFQPRTVDGVTFEHRRFLYGRNIKSMEPTRNFGKKTTQNIEVRSPGGNGNKTTLIGRFPTANPQTGASAAQNRLKYALPGNTQPDQKWSVYTLPGIKDKATLQKVAQGIYEQMGRQELEYTIQTKNLGSFGGDNTDPDILDLKTGDTVEVLVNRDSDETSTMTAMETALTAQQTNAALMVRLGFGQAFADAYARAYCNAGFTTTYRMKSMKVTWSNDQGTQIDLNCTNYIEVRADNFLPAGLEPGNVAMGPQQPPVAPPVTTGGP